jgi:hypothetical protein
VANDPNCNHNPPEVHLASQANTPTQAPEVNKQRQMWHQSGALERKFEKRPFFQNIPFPARQWGFCAIFTKRKAQIITIYEQNTNTIWYNICAGKMVFGDFFPLFSRVACDACATTQQANQRFRRTQFFGALAMGLQIHA